MGEDEDKEQDERPPTVGDIRRAIEGLADDAPVHPVWFDRIPADHEPAVTLYEFRLGRLMVDDKLVDCLNVGVGLTYGDERDEEEEE